MSIEEENDGRPVSCCFTVSNTRIPATNIVDYDIQDRVQCFVRAVRFQTKKNKIICSDPNDDWAKKVMAIVDSRSKRTIEHSKEPFVFDTSTANLIPTASTSQSSIPTEGKIRFPDDNWTKTDTTTANLIPITPTIQGSIITERDGHPVSCCYTRAITKNRIPSHLIRALKSHSKKGLRMIQMGILFKEQAS
ncbi:hypothetical protein Q8A67_008783 [Cirrhinus molitorella]|nr:hypothetical protein Q8A67_008783 [Cirrhinus molitorella]